MNCYWCDSDLIPTSDTDVDISLHPILGAEYSVRTHLTCPRCQADVEVLKKRDAFD